LKATPNLWEVKILPKESTGKLQKKSHPCDKGLTLNDKHFKTTDNKHAKATLSVKIY